MEAIQTNDILYALNIDIQSICFIFHAGTIISGEYVCSGLSNACLIQSKVSETDARLELMTSSDFPPSSHLTPQNHSLLTIFLIIIPRCGLEYQKLKKL